MSFPETSAPYQKWCGLFDLFEWAKDFRTGALIHLPASGGLLDQPAKTMAAFGVMREVWLKKLSDSFRNGISNI